MLPKIKIWIILESAFAGKDTGDIFFLKKNWE
jgi:hypothetical protein